MEKREKAAKAKLSYLNPKKQILWLFIFLFISFVGVVLAILYKDFSLFRELLIAISLICFGVVLVCLYKLFEVIIEARKTIDEDRRERETKTIELLSTLAEKEKDVFLKDINVAVDEKDILDEKVEITLLVNIKKSLEIVLRNKDNRMAKNVEIGFIFGHNFIIDKKENYSIFTDKKAQIVCFYNTLVQAKTDIIFDPIVITPIKEGIHPIKTFIKGENIHSIYRNFETKVRQVTFEDIRKDLFSGR